MPTEFEVMLDMFAAKHGLSVVDVQKALIAKIEPLTQEWRTAMRNLPQYCVECHKEHAPTEKCVPCEFGSGFLHAPMPPDIYFDYRGWRWTPPFICMGCGIEVCHRQWAFSRSCGSCDVSLSKTRRLLYLHCFSGPHEKLPTWSADKADIAEDHFVDPKDRMKFPVMTARMPCFPPPAPCPIKQQKRIN